MYSFDLADSLYCLFFICFKGNRGNNFLNRTKCVVILLPAIINVTARIINTIPQHNLGVRLSPKIVTPKNTAVTGSKAPRMAVGVEPIYCTACVVQRKDMAVGKIANAIRFPHKYHLSTTCRLCPKSTRTKKSDRPKSNT